MNSRDILFHQRIIRCKFIADFTKFLIIIQYKSIYFTYSNFIYVAETMVSSKRVIVIYYPYSSCNEHRTAANYIQKIFHVIFTPFSTMLIAFSCKVVVWYWKTHATTYLWIANLLPFIDFL